MENELEEIFWKNGKFVKMSNMKEVKPEPIGKPTFLGIKNPLEFDSPHKYIAKKIYERFNALLLIDEEKGYDKVNSYLKRDIGESGTYPCNLMINFYKI